MGGFTINGCGAADSFYPIKDLGEFYCPECRQKRQMCLMEKKNKGAVYTYGVNKYKICRGMQILRKRILHKRPAERRSYLWTCVARDYRRWSATASDKRKSRTGNRDDGGRISGRGRNSTGRICGYNAAVRPGRGRERLFC